VDDFNDMGGYLLRYA